MEDVLEMSHRPYNEHKPVICMDEQSVQLLGEKREPVSMNEHHCKQENNEYIRKGRVSVFMFVEPLGVRSSPLFPKAGWAIFKPGWLR
ncbi:MAG: hypothetical protein LBT93_01945 [Treponema sp.]|jgi:hypothetical protein|nr:hypothetical protein [Treponema sp.]